jgi:hypothetical protein
MIFFFVHRFLSVDRSCKIALAQGSIRFWVGAGLALSKRDLLLGHSTFTMPPLINRRRAESSSLLCLSGFRLLIFWTVPRRQTCLNSRLLKVCLSKPMI